MNLTQDDILTLLADDSRLRSSALIAMGWDRNPDLYVPDPANNIADAMALYDKLHERGWLLQLCQDEDSYWHVKLFKQTADEYVFVTPQGIASVLELSCALAITRACLLAASEDSKC